MNAGAVVDLLKTTYSEWSEDKASRLAAALAYYTAFSIAPLLLIAIAIAGLVFGDEAARGEVFGQLEGLIGPDGASVLQTAVDNSRQQGASTISAIVGLALLVWSAGSLFAQLQEALNTIWEVEPKPGAGIMGTLKRRFLSMSMVLGIGFLLLVSLVLSAALAAIGTFFNGLLPGSEVVWEAVNFVISFVVIALLFSAMYKVLPDVEIAWRDVWIGGAVTALLFTVGKLLLGLYLGHASVGSTYGAAGSLLVFLVWVYYSAQILFFGAEFTQVYARKYGTRMTPSEDAVPVSEEARGKEGRPRKEAVERAARTGESVTEAAKRPDAPVGAAASNGHRPGPRGGSRGQPPAVSAGSNGRASRGAAISVPGLAGLAAVGAAGALAVRTMLGGGRSGRSWPWS
jgi:membrane protein